MTRNAPRTARRSGSQLAFKFGSGWGGARRRAGRKPGLRPATPHRSRPVQRAGEPVHVTLRSRLGALRTQHVFPTVRLALLGAARRDPERFGIVHFSVQRDHVHLVVEAKNKGALSSGMRSVAIRITRYVNDLLGRRGPLWADRWYGRALRSPREVRNALVYVLANFRKHARGHLPAGIDPFSSGVRFDGWRGWRIDSGVPPPWAVPKRWVDDDVTTAGEVVNTHTAFIAVTWLATIGWRRHGLIGLDETPKTPA